MSTTAGPPRAEASDGGPYGGYGGALQRYGAPVPPPPVSAPSLSSGVPLPPPYAQVPYGPPPPYPVPYPLPYPPAYPLAYPPAHPQPTRPPQRPAGIGTASTLAVTASLLFVCGLGLLWMVAYSITSSFDAAADDQTVIFHVAERFQLRLTQGLAVPLIGFPVLGTVAGFLVVRQRSWARIVFTAAGLLSVGWSAWWLRQALGWWVPVVIYIGIACLIVWSKAATQWYADGDAREGG